MSFRALTKPGKKCSFVKVYKPVAQYSRLKYVQYFFVFFLNNRPLDTSFQHTVFNLRSATRTNNKQTAFFKFIS